MSSTENQSQPQPELLSLLEKAANPIQQLTIKIKVNGVYATPDQWKLTDDANPNMFGYQIKLLGQDFVGGKIQPRKLTQKELKEQQQKSKKGGKKQPKQQQKPPTQAQKQQQQCRQREWDALPQQQKFYRTQEDPYKAPSLQFPQKSKQVSYTRQNIQQLEQKINNDCIEVILTRKPELSEQDIQKTKKSKPKNLNLGELYPMVYKGVIRAGQLERPGSNKIVERVKLVFGGNMPDDGVKIENDILYTYVQIQLSQPVTPLVKQITPKTEQILPNFPSQSQKSPIQKLKQQLCRSIRAISQQYILCFAKQKQHTEQKRHTSSLTNQLQMSQSNPSQLQSHTLNISTLKLNQLNKRKEQFIAEFVNSGKFAILKERIAKSMKLVIIDKFRKEKQGGTITKEQINQTFSEFNLYFQEEFGRVIEEYLAGDGYIHEDLVLGYEYSKQSRKNVIAPMVSQTQIQRQTRLAQQYDILQKSPSQQTTLKSQPHYINIILLSSQSSPTRSQTLQAQQLYAKFCLRVKKFNQAYVLYKRIAEEFKQPRHRFIQAVLLVHRRRVEQAEAVLVGMMGEEGCQVGDKINYNLLLSFMYEREGDLKQSQKYLAIAQRYHKISQNPHLKFTPQQNPYKLPTPKLPKPERYVSQLSHKQSQQIRLTFINLLAQLNLYDLVEEYLPKLEDSNRKAILEILCLVWKGRYEEAVQAIEQVIARADNCRNVDYLLIKADICYRADKMFQCQQIFLQILQLKPSLQSSNPNLQILTSNTLLIYLRLAYIYLSRKSWQDAKSIFLKAVEHKYNCSVAWLGLGISNLELGCYAEAEEALNLAKIYDPLGIETQEYQSRVDLYWRNKYAGQTGGFARRDSKSNTHRNSVNSNKLNVNTNRNINDANGSRRDFEDD